MVFIAMNSTDKSKYIESVKEYNEFYEKSSSVAQDNIPSDEKKLILAVSNSLVTYEASKNEIQKSISREKRKNLIAASSVAFTVSNWVGVINRIDTSIDGKAIVSIRISTETEIGTWNNSLSDITSNTLIDKGSQVYDQVIPMSVGDKVKFSGSFLSADKDYFEERSLTTDGSMRNPEFLFRFNDIRPAN